MPPKKRGRPPGSKNKRKIIEAQTVCEYYVCQFCNKRFESKRSLNFHIKHCKKLVKPGFKCSQCVKRFRFKNNYKEHLKNEHSTTPGSVACTQCTVVCPNREILDKHVSNIHHRELYECEHCDLKFARYAHVLRHLSQTGCDGREVTLYPCEICEMKFNRKDNLMVHLRKQHISSNYFYCKNCEYFTKNFSKLTLHFQRTHMENPKLECDHCGRTTSSRAAMTKHMEIHGDKKYSCDVCGYKTFTVEVMRRHVLTHVTDKPHKCALCDRSYIQKTQLERHMEKHAVHQCLDCEKSFNSKDELLLHEVSHIGNAKLLCPVETCIYFKKEMESAEVLKKHIMTHYNTKPVVCEVCPKRFRSEAHMRRHLSTHSLERPRRCMYCVKARAYVRGAQLLRHVRVRHPRVFHERLQHVRRVLGTSLNVGRVKKSELESILNVLDAESDRIMDGYCAEPGVLYGGLQEHTEEETESLDQSAAEEDSPIMSEEELAESLSKLLTRLIDEDMLECFGWPDEPVDTVLEKVIENCGAKAAARGQWGRVQRLRENAKHLFLYVIEDKDIARMLDTHTIDQIVRYVLAQVSDDGA